MKTKIKKWGLFITHNVFLSRKERYQLADGETIETIGVSLPVWITQQTGKTSEPASEVFCNYQLINGEEWQFPKYDYKLKGYKIHLPQDVPEPERPSDDEWRLMNAEEQELWYQMYMPPPSIKRLKDESDGGCRYLRFDEHEKIKRKSGQLTVVHLIQLKTIEELEESLL